MRLIGMTKPTRAVPSKISQLTVPALAEVRGGGLDAYLKLTGQKQGDIKG
jgi:hypothetical protein